MEPKSSALKYSGKAIVFDLGGTLMEFSGMPFNWNDYYILGFEHVNQYFDLNLADCELRESAEILKSYNPRISKREIEIDPEVIFCDAIKNWRIKPDISGIINIFFAGMQLKANIYDYTVGLLKKCKDSGFFVACLTDLPNAMPDDLFQTAIREIKEQLDLYVSSQSCGVRKPNKGGMCMIAHAFHIETSDILFVGDEEKDHRTAMNAGCEFIYIKDFLQRKNYYLE